MRPQKPKTLYHLRNTKSIFLSKKNQKIGGEIMSKEDYRKEIIEMVEKIKRSDIIEYIYIITKDIIREDIERSDL